MAKTTKLTFPKFAGGKAFPSLKPLRSSLALVPYGGTYHVANIDTQKYEDAKKWFPFKENNDVLITSYPKCGHHLTQKICLEVIKANHDGKYTPDLYKTADMGLNTDPYIEYYVTAVDREEIEKRIKLTDEMYPRLWFTHHAFNELPINNIYDNKKNKIITMIRNPKDCIISCWSYYNYICKIRGDLEADPIDYSVDDLISYFVRGIMIYGCYFKWYETYWNAMNCDNYNILWLYFEDVLENPLQSVQKVAHFIFDGQDDINEPHKTCNISSDGYKQIIDRISFKSVKKDIMNNPQTFELGSAEQFFRRGINNDWKNYFNENQSELVDETMYFKWAEKANGIRYYQQLMNVYNDRCNHGYF